MLVCEKEVETYIRYAISVYFYTIRSFFEPYRLVVNCLINSLMFLMVSLKILSFFLKLSPSSCNEDDPKDDKNGFLSSI